MPPHRTIGPMSRWMRMAVLLWLVGVTAGCGTASTSNPPVSKTSGATCAANDQDQFVYDPSRLQVLQSCIRVTGRIDAVWTATDGDSNFLLHLDAPYQGLLTEGNQGGEEHGDLGVEAVCTLSPVDPIVMALCASDHDPYVGPHPPIGTHVWVEGRYILDLNHDSHAELHPLYRMGTLAS